MAEWRVRSVSLPNGIEDIVSGVGKTAGAAADFLDAVRVGLQVTSNLANTSVDLYSVLVNAFITSTEALLSDIVESGVYVLVDYPLSLNRGRLNPVSRVNLAGTVLDSRGGISGDPVTADESFRRNALGQSDLQAVATRRINWNPVSRDIMSYEEAIDRIVKAFDDKFDPIRPQFSDSANTVGVVLMAHSEDLATLMKLSRSISDIFAVDALGQLQKPGFRDLLDDVASEFSDLTQQEIDRLDFTPKIDLRRGGRHPNWVVNTKLRDLLPIVGDNVDAIIELIDLLRPNGSITDFVGTVLQALEDKVSRINDIVTNLETLSKQLETLSNTRLSSVVIESTTGNTGFKTALVNSGGHPEFQSSFVVSVVLYAGGPGGKVLKQLFSSAGEIVPDSLRQAVDNRGRNVPRPILEP